MATAPLRDSRTNSDVWSHFTEEMRDELLREDRIAGESVCGILITIVAVGLLLGILAVSLAV